MSGWNVRTMEYFRNFFTFVRNVKIESQQQQHYKTPSTTTTTGRLQQPVEASSPLETNTSYISQQYSVAI